MVTSAPKPSPLPGMGANVAHDGVGVSFRVWAPHADQVYVAGNFTEPMWDEGKVPLVRDGEASGYWSILVLAAKANHRYAFIISRKDQSNLWRLDPYCRQVEKGVNSNGDSSPQSKCVIIDCGQFKKEHTQFSMPPWNELVIYELHLGTFNDNGIAARRLDDAIQKLDYLADLGINAIEIMPCAQFETETSMGYNPSLLFAIERNYGEEQGLQKFVHEANARGIAVIFDVVYNHLGPDNLGLCFWCFDGWNENSYGGIYFYQDERAYTDFGATRPDYGRPEVRQILRDNAMMWLHEYHANGLRLDSTVNIRRSRQGDLSDGWRLMQWINRDRDPTHFSIAEDLEDNEWLTKNVEEGGAGFSSQWDIGFYRTIRDAVVPTEDCSRSMSAVRDALNKRYNGDAFQRVIYTESHDEVSEHSGFKLGRMPEKIWPGNADSWPSRKRSTLATAVLLTSPGVPMLFQVCDRTVSRFLVAIWLVCVKGQEFLEAGTWTDSPKTNPHAMLDWTKATKFSGILRLHRDLIRLRRNKERSTRGLLGQKINVFHTNEHDKVIAYHRSMEGGQGDDVIVVANFSTQTFHSYTIGFPHRGAWNLRFNSDCKDYSEDFTDIGYGTVATEGGYDGFQFQGNVGLGPYSLIILSQ